jgi:signal transduction histidine kinase
VGKDEFLGVLSHELRNPLAPIQNSLYILGRAEPGSDQARRAREVASRQLAHLTRLVDDLLDVTRIARGKIQLRRGDVDLAELVRRTGEDYRALLRERGLELVLEAPRAPVWGHGDEVRLSQAIGNLLQNAAKFTASGGQVALALEVTDRMAEIHVRDSGAGIGPELLETIFEPFTQGEQTLARTEGGLGLGLALVKGIAELHGGTVRAMSPGKGEGSEFIVSLPLDEPAMTQGGRAEASDAGTQREPSSPWSPTGIGQRRSNT